MHPYSTDSSERKYIPLLLLFVSIIFSMISIFLWDKYIHAEGILGQIYSVIGYIIDFSVIFYYELFYYLFDKKLWKYFSFLPFMKVPNLNGKWEGTLNSSYPETEDAQTTVNSIMEISQSWQNIEIRLTTGKTKSKTKTSAFITENSEAIELIYQYLSEPNPHTESTMHIHKGTGLITLKNDNKAFEGEYYNGRDSKNHGSLKFSKIEN